jgi:hypothetical protein
LMKTFNYETSIIFKVIIQPIINIKSLRIISISLGLIN